MGRKKRTLRETMGNHGASFNKDRFPTKTGKRIFIRLTEKCTGDVHKIRKRGKEKDAKFSPAEHW